MPRDISTCRTLDINSLTQPNIYLCHKESTDHRSATIFRFAFPAPRDIATRVTSTRPLHQPGTDAEHSSR
ncbi:hypothetical protein E2C01_078099 [Portunus trituberculatus]|uniref:Uncharacterized protein n=1 Tax=Portunus trituberculatus TaxID=210409 RepID=A0A5B7IG47_PORTR|nr:hypothetical protein [Portunus trituberculatus]